jgi:WD40 repeat protein
VNAVAVGVQDDRPVIVSGSSDRMVRVWDLGTGEPALGPLTGHDGGVNAADVRAYDADDLETWLERAPSVHHWISEQLSREPRDA